jgi:hypothetical protein
MYPGRYVLAVVVGLTLGIAGGWLTHQPSEPPTPHRQSHHRRAGPQPVEVAPDQTAPQTPPQTQQPLGAQRIQRMLDRCLSKPTALGQLSCLERVLELEWRYNPEGPSYDDLLSAPLGSSAYT